MGKIFKIKRKNFTIPEGHFTGTKDMEEIPSLFHNIKNGVLIGSGIGAAAGGVLGHFDDNSSVICSLCSYIITEKMFFISEKKLFSAIALKIRHRSLVCGKSLEDARTIHRFPLKRPEISV